MCILVVGKRERNKEKQHYLSFASFMANVGLADLFAADYIKEGQKVELIYIGKRWNGLVSKDGELVFKLNWTGKGESEKTFNKPASAALTCVRTVQPKQPFVNGWKHLQIEGQTLDEIRVKFREDRNKQTVVEANADAEIRVEQPAIPIHANRNETMNNLSTDENEQRVAVVDERDTARITELEEDRGKHRLAVEKLNCESAAAIDLPTREAAAKDTAILHEEKEVAPDIVAQVASEHVNPDIPEKDPDLKVFVSSEAEKNKSKATKLVEVIRKNIVKEADEETPPSKLLSTIDRSPKHTDTDHQEQADTVLNREVVKENTLPAAPAEIEEDREKLLKESNTMSIVVEIEKWIQMMKDQLFELDKIRIKACEKIEELELERKRIETETSVVLEMGDSLKKARKVQDSTLPRKVVDSLLDAEFVSLKRGRYVI